MSYCSKLMGWREERSDRGGSCWYPALDHVPALLKQGINHSAVWHGACCCRRCAEQWVLRALRHGVSSWSSYLGLKPLQTVHLHAKDSHMCMHPSPPHWPGSPHSLQALGMPPLLVSELGQANPTHLKLLPSPLSLFRSQAWSPRRCGLLRT